MEHLENSEIRCGSRDGVSIDRGSSNRSNSNRGREVGLEVDSEASFSQEIGHVLITGPPASSF